MLCDDLEGCGRGGWEGGSRGRGYIFIYIHMADSFYCTAETNTTLLDDYIPIKIKKKKNILRS